MRANGGITSEFSFTIGLHQGSTLSSCLLALVIGELARPIQDEAPWCMFFLAKDIILVDQTRCGVNTKFDLEGYFRIYRIGL